MQISVSFPVNTTDRWVLADTMFRLIVKKLKPQNEEKIEPRKKEKIEPQKKEKNYYWIEMGYFTRWTDRSNLLVCFNTPEEFRQQFVDTLQARQNDAGECAHKPYALHIILMDFLIHIYDQSIWDMSNKVREIEEVRAFWDSDCILKKLTATN